MNNTIMDIRKILNKLSESELEVLKSELDNDIEDAIDSVIDTKNSPSVFAIQYKAGDVFVFETCRAKYIVQIKKIDNPHVSCERIELSGQGVSLILHAHYRVDDFNSWTKVNNDWWEKAKSILEIRNKAINDLKTDCVKSMTEMLGAALEDE